MKLFLLGTEYQSAIWALLWVPCTMTLRLLPRIPYRLRVLTLWCWYNALGHGGITISFRQALWAALSGHFRMEAQ